MSHTINPKETQNKSQQKGAIESNKSKIPTDRKLMFLFLIGFVVLVLGVIFFTIIKSNGSSTGSSGSDTNYVALMPIWIAVFIPIIAANKKKKDGQPEIPKNKKIILAVIVGLTVLLVLGTIFLGVFNK
ncbi:hypothetical protein HOB30_00415 [Candidatus Falkowbacteria bacterium]|nr:hypothetical protein [Candidatus Falkowbacteria bacterium]